MEELNQTTPALKIEQLLRVKRAERPAPEFWDAFDRDLKRELFRTAVTQPVPWMARMRAGLKTLRAALPVTVSAAFVMMLHIHSSQPLSLASNESVPYRVSATFPDHAHSTGAVAPKLHSADFAQAEAVSLTVPAERHFVVNTLPATQESALGNYATIPVQRFMSAAHPGNLYFEAATMSGAESGEPAASASY